MKHCFLLILLTTFLLGIGVPQIVDAATQEDVVGFWTIELSPGFNLVNFPVLPKTPTLTEVIGDQLGAVEISTWDDRLGNYRWAQYTPQTGRWSGNMFLLNRGTAYWVNVLEAENTQNLVVKGHPEEYTRFHWHQLGSGWKFFGSTFGQEQELSEIPPESAGNLILRWNPDAEQFELAENASQQAWYAPEFQSLKPSEGYLVHVLQRGVRPAGPPTDLESQHELIQDPEAGVPQHDQDGFNVPPWPLIVGNQDGIAVCDQNGDACSSGFRVHIVREVLRQGLNGQLEPIGETVSSYEVTDGGIEPGKFRLALTIGFDAEYLNPGDRVYFLVEGPQGSTTRSTSFEIPRDERFVADISFPNPLSYDGQAPLAPTAFEITSPFPNPFNDRFSVEFSLPEKAAVSYRLFNLMGREVYGASRPMTAGVHRLTISGNNMATGLYLLQIEAGVHRGLVKVAHVK